MDKIIFHPTKNEFTQNEVSSGSKRKAWWLCPNGHEWQAQIYTISKGHGCPSCAGKIVTEQNSLTTKMPHLLVEFHPSKNILLPNQVSYSSNKKIWWICRKGHEW